MLVASQKKVPRTPGRHKRLTGVMRVSILLSCLHLAVFTPAVAQVRVGDAAAVLGAGVVFLAPTLFGFTPSVPAPCGPCDPAGLPGYDRWALTPFRSGWSTGSSVLGIATIILPIVDLWNEGDAGRARAASVIEATSWAVAASELIKVAVARSRPALYQPGVTAGEVNSANNRESFPSGHTAGAVAAATAYWLARRDLDGRSRWTSWIPWGLALGTGVMRITAGKHFPSDVAGGIGFGIVSALVVREIRF